MSTRLLDRQISLLKYLTSGRAVFGADGGEVLDPALQGIDSRLLRLEACFSHEKRMEKISAVFHRTIGLLGSDQDAIVREFVGACPSIDITRLENARQFYDFLCARWRHEPVDPPYLRDVAACEFACVKARVGAEGPESQAAQDEHSQGDRIRRHPGVTLLRCAYNIRPIFEGDAGAAAPVKRNTSLVIAMPPDAEHPQILELLPPAFDVLAALDDWTDPIALGPVPELDELIGDLAEHGLVELRR
jgi:hypothetical protein